MLQRDPAFAEAVLGDNLDVFQNILRQQHQQKQQLERQKQEEIVSHSFFFSCLCASKYDFLLPFCYCHFI
jgi:hypothetical protein